MADIVTKLNLNRTPRKVDNNSLVYAKNIRLSNDGSICKDYNIRPISFHTTDKHYDEKYYNTFVKIVHDFKSFADKDTTKDKYYQYFYNIIYNIVPNELDEDYDPYVSGYLQGYESDGFKTYNKYRYLKVVGVIPDANDFYIFIRGTILDYIGAGTYAPKSYDLIVGYNEVEDKFFPCNCHWTYSGGTISGYVQKNLLGHVILCVGEKANVIVPFKTINLQKSSYEDDESIYTQAPNIPLTNLNFVSNYNHSIPNGVYQFFIRYQIRDGFYTNWFPCSRELFAGNSKIINTNFGTVKTNNTHLDSDNSFIFHVEHINDKAIKNYTKFQLGYILSHDDSIVARAWKHFDINTEEIYFDYSSLDITEIEVIDLLSPTFQIYNVGNVTSFKNRLYISNYVESTYDNAFLQKKADEVKIDIVDSNDGNSKIFKYYAAKSIYNGGNFYINSISENAISDSSSQPTVSVKDIIKDIFNKANDNEAVDSILKDNFTYNYNGLKELIKTAIFAKNGQGVYPIKNNVQHYLTIKDSDEHGISKDVASFTFLDTDEYKVKNGLELSNLINNTNLGGISYKDIVINDNNIYLKYTITDFDNNKLVFIDEKPIVIEGNTVDEKINNLNEAVDNILKAISEKIDYIDSRGAFCPPNFKAIEHINIEITRGCKYTKVIQTVIPPVPENTPINPGPDIDDNSNRNPDNSLNNPNNNSFIEVNPIAPNGGQIQITELQNQEGECSKTITMNIVYYKDLIKLQTNEYNVNYTTLVPLQGYQFFIHFVKPTGEVSEGFLCGGDEPIIAKYKYSTNAVLYPSFRDITIPDGYIACFFTIKHVLNNVSTLYSDNNITARKLLKRRSAELNAGLMTGYKNLDVYVALNNEKEDVNNYLDTSKVEHLVGNYYYSGDSTILKYFGAGGIVEIESNNSVNPNKNVYLVQTYNTKSKNNDLIKCTPYIKSRNYSDFSNLNLGGYICEVYPYSEEIYTYYSDGVEIYKKVVDSESKDAALELKELSKYDGDSPSITNFMSGGKFSSIQHKAYAITEPVYIYSNYNLNYLTADEQDILKNKTVTTYEGSANESKTNRISNSYQLRLITSLTSSSLYSLPSMYNDYTRRTYTKYDETITTLHQFNNTIRGSKLEGDEALVNIYKFEANDYYNIPADKGIITNLVAVGDSILVHTINTMYRFSGSNSLSSNNGEIIETESQPFDTGVAEVFGAEFGYAGLQSKAHQILTEVGYIFYDSIAKIIYMYSGQGQIIKISDSIEEIFNIRDIKDIHFANDFGNNRIFVNIVYRDNDFVTLSYSLLPDVKAFISLHDFRFNKSFSTRGKCYFFNNDTSEILTIHKYDVVDRLYKQNKDQYFDRSVAYFDLAATDLYPSFKSSKNILYYYGGKLDGKGHKVDFYECIIDIINNTDSENVKTLNYIEWIGETIDKAKNSFLGLVANYDTLHTCNRLLIYSDICHSKLIDIQGTTDNLQGLDYKQVRYNRGKWTFNYFRDIRNISDIYHYLIEAGYISAKYDDSRTLKYKGSSSDNLKYGAVMFSDNNSLIEGTYFVVRFHFDREFKLETLTLNYDITA